MLSFLRKRVTRVLGQFIPPGTSQYDQATIESLTDTIGGLLDTDVALRAELAECRAVINDLIAEKQSQRKDSN